jgi:hypothetical protein
MRSVLQSLIAAPPHNEPSFFESRTLRIRCTEKISPADSMLLPLRQFHPGILICRLSDAEGRRGTQKKHCLMQCFRSPSWARTNDIVINSHALYRLSYRGILPSLISQDITHPCGCHIPSKLNTQTLPEHPLFILSIYGP